MYLRGNIRVIIDKNSDPRNVQLFRKYMPK